MKTKPQKYSKKLSARIYELIEKDSYSVAEICKTVGISDRTFYNWQSTNADFAQAVKEARNVFDKKVLEDANKSLVKLISGYEYEEVKTTVVDDGKGKPKIKEKTTIKKHVAPNLGAIIHYQTNKSPEEWQNKQRTEVTGKDGEALNAAPPVFIFKNLNEE